MPHLVDEDEQHQPDRERPAEHQRVGDDRDHHGEGGEAELPEVARAWRSPPARSAARPRTRRGGWPRCAGEGPAASCPSRRERTPPRGAGGPCPAGGTGCPAAGGTRGLRRVDRSRRRGVLGARRWVCRGLWRVERAGRRVERARRQMDGVRGRRRVGSSRGRVGGPRPGCVGVGGWGRGLPSVPHRGLVVPFGRCWHPTDHRTGHLSILVPSACSADATPPCIVPQSWTTPPCTAPGSP